MLIPTTLRDDLVSATGKLYEISIPVVNPTCEDDIQLTISNREITERNKLDTGNI